MARNGTLPTKMGLKLGAKGQQVARLQRLLIDLAYLRQPDDSETRGFLRQGVAVVGEIGTFDEGTQHALTRFQEGHGVKPSGELDRLTLRAFEGMPCRATALRIGDPDKRIYTYAILNDHPDVSGSVLSRAIEQAFAIWALHIPLSFAPTRPDASPDITFRFVPHEDGVANALIEFNANLNWRVGSGSGNSYDLISVATHEIGHKLGLHHTIPPVTGSVMNETVDNSAAYRAIGGTDRQRVQAEHGSQAVRDTTMTHGNSVTLESSDTVVSFRPMGPYTRVTGVQGLSTSWFHFAPATPVRHGESANPESRLHAVWLNVRTYDESEITRVHIWDGDTFLGQHTLQYGGGLGGGPRDWYLRLGVARKPRLDATGGVGISVDVRWKFGTDATRRVDFVSAGADLIEYQRPFGPISPDDISDVATLNNA
jgi:peptidoglycan hydrolase-like protein with peptidoglycan-binding domain